MAKENEKDVLDEEIAPANDTTDWEARAKELENKIGRARDSRKSLRDRYESELAGLKAQLELAGNQSKETKPSDEVMKRLDEQATTMQRMMLQVAQITEADEVELAEQFAKRTGLTIPEILKDDIFQAKLEKIRTDKSNIAATEKIKGGGGQGSAKNNAAYWNAKGTPPTPDDISDAKTRRAIVKEMRKAKSTKSMKFYNE